MTNQQDLKQTIAIAKLETKMDNLLNLMKDVKNVTTQNRELIDSHVRSHSKDTEMWMKTLKGEFATKEELKPLERFMREWKNIERKIGRTAIFVVVGLFATAIAYFTIIKNKLGL